MPEQWLTYRQLGELWNTTPEAARARCRRGQYERRTNQHGMSEVLFDTDSIVAASRPGPQNWMPNLDPDERVPGTSDQTNRQTLQAMEEQVAALRWECHQAEQKVELLRRYLETEREQSAQLMKLLQHRHHGRRTGRRILARLLFWRASAQTILDETGHAASHAAVPVRSTPVIVPDMRPDTPDMMHSTPVTGPDTPDGSGSSPDIRPDRVPDTPDPALNSPDSETSPLT